MVLMRTLDYSGHKELAFDPEVMDDRLKAAEEEFNTQTEKGYVAFAFEKKGGEGKQVKKFTQLTGVEEVILQPAIVGG